MSEVVTKIYQHSELLGHIADVRHGLSTGKNELFVRLWTEVEWNKANIDITDRNQLKEIKARYFPYNKGGEYRKWFGNADYVIWYNLQGQAMMSTLSGHRHDGRDMYFKEGITWSFISSCNFGVRYTPSGFVFDVAGSSMFMSHDMIKYLVGLLCSCLGQYFMSFQNPTLNYQVGNLKDIPVIVKNKECVENLVNENISLSKADWDSFETSWNFKRNPLI